MGGSFYSMSARLTRSADLGYDKATAHDTKVFKQNALRKINQGMDPSMIAFREARDSEVHPTTVPIVLQLDVTGSMGRIPADLIKGDLPHLMGHMIEGECPHAALLFMAAGDVYCDQAPLQIGQFESGDAELDHWLTSTWIEGNGGGNAGESYSLGWLFALNCIGTDAWDKRGQKGLFISVGDEPMLPEMPVRNLKRLFGDQFNKVTEGLQFGADITAAQVLEKIQDKWSVHHIQVGERPSDYTRETWGMLGENFHVINRSASIVDAVRKIVKDHMVTCVREGVKQQLGDSEPDTSVTPVEETRPTGAAIPDPI